MIIMIIACIFVAFVLHYFLYKLSRVAHSNLWIFSWIQENKLKDSLDAFPWIFCIIVFGCFLFNDSALDVSKDYAWENVQARELAESRLAQANLEILALKDEKRFAFQPVQVAAVEAAKQENPQKEDASQNKVVLATGQTEQAKEQAPSVKTESENEGNEADLAKMKEKLDAIELGIKNLQIIAAMQAQASASQATPVPANAGIQNNTGGAKMTNAVATMN